MKKFLFAFIASLFLFSCAKEGTTELDSTQKDTLVSKTEINQHIRTIMDRDGIYDWKHASDEILFSAAMSTDSIYALGYQTAATDDMENNIHLIDINSSKWLETRDEILNLILKNERELNAETTLLDLLPYGYPENLPSMEVRISNPNTIPMLREMEEVRYLESISYVLAPDNAVERSSSGCGVTPSYNINSADYTNIALSLIHI